MSNEAGHFYAFGAFRLDSAKRVLLRDGQPVPLAPKAVETLLVLVENAGQLVEKAELMQRVWPDAFVEEGNLSKNIYILRSLLGNGHDGREYLETVPKRGYRFVAAVSVLPPPRPRLAVNETVALDQKTNDTPLADAIAAKPENGIAASWSRLAEEALPAYPEPVHSDFIELLPVRDGAEETAEVDHPKPDRRSEAALPAPQIAATRRMRWPLVLAALAVLAATGVAWFLKPRHQARTQPSEREITANPPEDFILGAAISPNGEHVAYVDQTGLYVRSVDSGETRAISVPPALVRRMFRPRWLPSGGKLLVTSTSSSGVDLWVITVLGEAAPHLLYHGGMEPAVSPDGQQIAFVTNRWDLVSEVQIGGINGDAARTLVKRQKGQYLFSPVWSPDGRWIAYFRAWQTAPGRWSHAIEIRPASGGPAKTVVGESGFRQSRSLSRLASGSGLAWLPDWRLLFDSTQAPESPAAQMKSSLWAIRVLPKTGEPAGQPQKLAVLGDHATEDMTVSADGKRLVFVRSATWDDVYLGRLAPGGASIAAPRRFTLDTRGSEITGWTRDSQAIIFSSDRNGKSEIFRRGLNDNVSQAVLERDGTYNHADATISPGGSWVLYEERKFSVPGATPSPVRLMRRPIAGGPAATVLEEPAGVQLKFWCPLKRRASCILSEAIGRRDTFYLFDPIRGKGDRVATAQPGASEWIDGALSPDGKRLALVDALKLHGPIEILNVPDRTWHELSLDPRWGDLQSIAWAANGKGFFATSWLPNSFNLLHVTLTGKVQPLQQNGHRQWMFFPRPSPDGKYLAYGAKTWDSNAWLLEGF